MGHFEANFLILAQGVWILFFNQSLQLKTTAGPVLVLMPANQICMATGPNIHPCKPGKIDVKFRIILPLFFNSKQNVIYAIQKLQSLFA